MANTPSAIKRVRQNLKRRAHNRTIRSATRSYVKAATVSLQSGNKEEAAEAVRQAVSQVDRAAKRGIIHRNTAARRKSRLMRQLNELS